MKAPMMNASWATSASTAKPRIRTRPAIVRVVPEREKRLTASSSRGTTSSPTTPLATRKTRAARIVVDTTPTVTVSPVTTFTTTVRMISPSTSSATAAPSTILASVVASALRSPNTRAVIPTLVAVSAAPRNTAVSEDHPRASPAPMPATNGTTTPITATDIDARPTRPSSARSISMPTCTSSSSTPISASICRLTPRSPSSWTRPSTEGPMTIPATISPRTAGIDRRSTTSAAILAAATTIRRSSSSRARSTDSTAASTSADARHDRDGDGERLRAQPPAPPTNRHDGRPVRAPAAAPRAPTRTVAG